MEGHDRLLTTGEVCFIFRVDPKTVRRWRQAGKLSVVRTPGGRPRYRESEIRALAAIQTPGSTGPPPTVPPVEPGPDSKEGRPRR